jgi:uncharacterized protein (DUF433 family)
MPAIEPVSHVRVDDRGVAWIDESSVKVVEVITDHIAYGYSPEEIRLQYPHLSLAQIYAAFAYYSTPLAANWRPKAVSLAPIS